MDGRKKRVLEALIDDYIATAEPVGSRTLARKYQLGVSPATIRNEMADLEELGLLEHPHTSSGRVPSDKGYRYYVDELMQPVLLNRSERERIQRAYDVRIRELHWFIHQTARLVSELTHYPSLVIAPPVRQSSLLDLSFVPLGDSTILMVLKTSTGMVENQTLLVPDEFDAEKLKRLAEDFTKEFRGVAIKELKTRILDPLQGDISRYQELWQLAMQWVTETEARDDNMTVAGPLNILDYPEFHDVEKVRRVWSFLERQSAVDIANRYAPGGVHVVIGTESLEDDIVDCSLVAASYQVGHSIVGHLMVLGPRRMHYNRVMTIVEAVSEELSRVLHG